MYICTYISTYVATLQDTYVGTYVGVAYTYTHMQYTCMHKIHTYFPANLHRSFVYIKDACTTFYSTESDLIRMCSYWYSIQCMGKSKRPTECYRICIATDLRDQ